MDESGPIFSPGEAREAAGCFRDHLNAYMWLASYYFQKRALYFKLRCKTHYNFHLADEIESTQVNPKIYENFEEESFLGKIKKIAVHCHGGTCTQRVFMRYLLGLGISLETFRKQRVEWNI